MPLTPVTGYQIDLSGAVKLRVNLAAGPVHFKLIYSDGSFADYQYNKHNTPPEKITPRGTATVSLAGSDGMVPFD